MNIHVKIWDSDDNDRMIEKIASLIEKYDCKVYGIARNENKIFKFVPTEGESNGIGFEADIPVEYAKYAVVRYYTRTPHRCQYEYRFFGNFTKKGVHSSGKQCLCIYKRPKSPISAEAEVGDSFAC